MEDQEGRLERDGEEVISKKWQVDYPVVGRKGGRAMGIGKFGERFSGGARRSFNLLALFAMFAAGFIMDAGAAYATVEQAELSAADGVAGDEFGYSVSLSGDGNTALVGAPIHTVGANTAQGAAYVYIRTNGAWQQQAELAAPDGVSGGLFGNSVAISGDGNTALVGAFGKPGYIGAAYIFVRNGGAWGLQAILKASDGYNGLYFGASVALSGDGNTALVGAYGYYNYQGAAYVFVRDGTVWTQQEKLTAPDLVMYDGFGSAVALSADGNTALIGAHNKTVGANAGQGAAYVFTRNGTTWAQQQKLTADDGDINALFGSAVSLSGNGNIALIGATKASAGQINDAGAAYTFMRSGTVWTQQFKLIAGDAANNAYFGWSVSLSGDGTLALIGAIGDNAERGAVYVFKPSMILWIEQEKIVAGDGAANDRLGNSVSLSSNGGTALAGAHDSLGSQGAAYVFVKEYNVNATVLYGTGGVISCSPNPVPEGEDSVCAMTPTNVDPNYYHISDVTAGPEGAAGSVGPASRYTFKNVAGNKDIQVTFVTSNIWLYNNASYQATEHTIGGALVAAWLNYQDTNTLRIKTGAYSEPGGVICLAVGNVTPKLSGGWNTETTRSTYSMSAIAGPLKITGSCALIIDRITVE